MRREIRNKEIRIAMYKPIIAKKITTNITRFDYVKFGRCFNNKKNFSWEPRSTKEMLNNFCKKTIDEFIEKIVKIWCNLKNGNINTAWTLFKSIRFASIIGKFIESSLQLQKE